MQQWQRDALLTACCSSTSSPQPSLRTSLSACLCCCLAAISRSTLLLGTILSPLPRCCAVLRIQVGAAVPLCCRCCCSARTCTGMLYVRGMYAKAFSPYASCRGSKGKRSSRLSQGACRVMCPWLPQQGSAAPAWQLGAGAPQLMAPDSLPAAPGYQ